MPRLTQPTQPLFNNIICTKKEVVETLVKECFVSKRTAYRIVAGQRKCANQYEEAAVINIVTNRLQQLQLAL